MIYAGTQCKLTSTYAWSTILADLKVPGALNLDIGVARQSLDGDAGADLVISVSIDILMNPSDD